MPIMLQESILHLRFKSLKVVKSNDQTIYGALKVVYRSINRKNL